MAKIKSTKGQSTKHTHKTKDRVTWTPLKTRDEIKKKKKIYLPWLVDIEIQNCELINNKHLQLCNLDLDQRIPMYYSITYKVSIYSNNLLLYTVEISKIGSSV